MAAQYDGGMAVSVKLHDAPATFFFSDFDGTGHSRNGSIVLSALKNHRQIYIDSSGDDNKMAFIIPYHSVDAYDYEIIPYDREKPSDAFCVDRSPKGADSLVGSAIVGESTVGGE